MATNTTSNRFPKYLSAADFGYVSTGTDITVSTSKWTLLYEYTVPAQQEIAVGISELYSGGAQGAPAYMRFDDTAGAQWSNALFRVQITDANEVNTQVIYEDLGTRWSASQTDRTLAKLLPEDGRRAQEDSKIQITMKADTLKASYYTTVDVSDADTNIVIPVTVYTVRR